MNLGNGSERKPRICNALYASSRLGAGFWWWRVGDFRAEDRRWLIRPLDPIARVEMEGTLVPIRAGGLVVSAWTRADGRRC